MGDNPIEISYGVVPIRYSSEQPEVLLIQNNGGHWSFPKGHHEGIETGVETARRELREETGIIKCEINKEPYFRIEFQIQRDGQTIDRRIDFFIGTVSDVNLAIDPYEVHDSMWLTVDKALGKLTFPESKKVLENVVKYLKSR